ncbi:MAG: hypothetical protein NTW96_01545 [Planctomycetia bacterium]|nr:hypothetical protein [Planctomycetia bacterium]
MVITCLVVLNIPVYLFIGWLAFDSKSDAAATFGETIVDLLKILLVPGIVRVLFGMETSGALGLIPIGGYLFACSLLTYGEYILLGKCFGLQ